MRALQLVAACALAVLLAGCATDRVTNGVVLQWYDIEEDIEMGSETLAAFQEALRVRNIPVDSDERMLAEIRDITERIARVSHYPELPWEAHLAEVKEPNAWCAPGGKIMVYRGLFDREVGLVQTRHELAAILAHECAHATARHVTRSRSRTYTLLVSALPVYLALAVFAPAALSPVSQAFDIGVNVYLPSYSRGQEEEADAVGLIYMAKAGYDPRAAIRIWKRAAGREGSRFSLYSTHPDHAARAEALEERLPEAMKLYEAARAGSASATAP